jgi:hypothetical protein
MDLEAQNSNEVLYVCGECDRKIVFKKNPPDMIVIDQGDFFALHYGGQLNMTADVVPNGK